MYMSCIGYSTTFSQDRKNSCAQHNRNGLSTTTHINSISNYKRYPNWQ